MKRGDLVQDISHYGTSWVGIVLCKSQHKLYGNDGSGCQVWWVLFQNAKIIDVSESSIKVIA